MDRNEAADYFSAKNALNAALEEAFQADIRVAFAADRLKVAERALDAVLATIAAPI